MTGNETAIEQEPEPAVAESGKSGKSGSLIKWLSIVVGFFLLATVSQVVTLKVIGPLLLGIEDPAASEEVVEEEPALESDKGPALYLALDPPLVVSIEDGSGTRFLQAGIEVMGRDDTAMEAVTTHDAVIRNNLLMLLGGQSVADLATREGKESLRRAALAEVRAVMLKKTGDPGVEDLYFTSFVIQ